MQHQVNMDDSAVYSIISVTVNEVPNVLCHASFMIIELNNVIISLYFKFLLWDYLMIILS